MPLSGVNIIWYTESSVYDQFKQNIVQESPGVYSIRIPFKVKGSGTSSTGGHIFIDLYDSNGNKVIDQHVESKSIGTSDWDKEIWTLHGLKLDPDRVYKLTLSADAINHVSPYTTVKSGTIELYFSVNKGIVNSFADEPLFPGDIDFLIKVVDITDKSATLNYTVTNNTIKKSPTNDSLTLYIQVQGQNDIYKVLDKIIKFGISAQGSISDIIPLQDLGATKKYYIVAGIDDTTTGKPFVNQTSEASFTTATPPPPPPPPPPGPDPSPNSNAAKVLKVTGAAAVVVGGATAAVKLIKNRRKNKK